MSDVIIFHSPFGDIRAITEDDINPLFIAKDVTSALGYDDAISAIKQHCKGVVKHRFIKDSQGCKQSMRVLDKTDFYRLVFNSKLKSATKYQNLIFEEILKNNGDLIELIGYDVRETREKINITAKIEE